MEVPEIIWVIGSRRLMPIGNGVQKNGNFTFKIVFFGHFKNDNILSSKSYTVTKSEISPQRKLGSLQNLKLKLIKH